MADDFLSQDEVDALLQGVDDDIKLETGTPADPDDQKAASAVPAAKDSRIENCTLASLEGLSHSRLPRLETLHDRFCSFYQISLEKFLGKNTEVLISPVKQVRYDYFLKNLILPASINLSQIKPLKGTALFVLEPDLIFLIIDQLFGGQGRPNASAEGRDFTPTELRIIQRVLADLFENYSKAWESVYPVKIETFRAETQTRFVKIANPEDLVITATITLHFGSSTGHLHLCLPVSMIEPIRSLLDTEEDTSQEVDKRWQQRMSRQLQSAEVELIARMVEINVTLGDLMKMQPGDFLPFDMPETIPVQVDEVPIMTCNYGISNHQYALRVEKLLGQSSGSPS